MNKPIINISKQLALILLCLLATACATTPKSDDVATNDRIESVNRGAYQFNEGLDKHLLKPVAEAYVEAFPSPVRRGATNFFSNLKYPNVILNSFLQGKFEQGVNDSLRFIFNSTIGMVGVFDVAGDDLGLAKNDEDFGQTLATWGVDQGSYLYLPLAGPNTVRNSADFVPSTLLNPLFYVGASLLPVSMLNVINTRANLLEASNLRDEAAVDPYIFTREAYLQQRQYLIYDGNPPISDDVFSDFEADDEPGGILTIE